MIKRQIQHATITTIKFYTRLIIRFYQLAISFELHQNVHFKTVQMVRFINYYDVNVM